jgi:HEAT repeat protein
VRRTTDVGVLAALAGSLAVVPGNAAYKRLAELAKHGDASVRRAAAASLTRRSEAGAKALVGAMAGDADVQVRILATGSADSAALETLAQDPNPNVAFAAQVSLVRSGGQRQALAQMCRELAAARTEVARASVAGAWLAGGLPAGK